MIRLAKLTDYGIVLMSHMARLSKLAGGFAPHAQRYSTLTVREHEIYDWLGEVIPIKQFRNRWIFEAAQH